METQQRKSKNPRHSGLCRADTRWLDDLLDKVRRYAEGCRQGTEYVDDLAKMGMPSLRGRLEPEDRGYVRLVLATEGEIQIAHGAGISTLHLGRGAFLRWTEDRGRKVYRICRTDHDKYGAYDQEMDVVPPTAVIQVSEEFAKAHLRGEDHPTLEELMRVKYMQEFGPPDDCHPGWLPPPETDKW